MARNAFGNGFELTPSKFDRVVKALGNVPSNILADGISFECVVFSYHGQAKVNRRDLNYSCRDCLDLYSQAQLNSLFEAWVSSANPTDKGLLAHLNPFDAKGEGFELAFWKDIEGSPLLYRGFVHFLYGKPETLKSWFVLNLLHEADVRIWDFENGLMGTKNRLVALGVDRSRANGYASPETREEIAARVKQYVDSPPEILIIDGFSGFAQVLGINPDSNTEVMEAYGEVFVPLKKASVTVIVIDHLPKDSLNFDYPIGAQAKKSQADVALFFKATAATNAVDLYVSKDRHGALNSRSEGGASLRKLGTLRLISAGSGVSLQVTPSYSAALDGSEIKSTDARLLSVIFDFVKANPNCSKTEVEQNVEGQNQRIRDCIKLMISEKYLVINELCYPAHRLVVSRELDLKWKPLGRAS